MSRDIALNLIDPDPDQPRQHFDQAGIEELAQSIEAKGLIVPIMVRPDGDRYVIVHGERRWRAALSLDWETIPAEVRDVSPEEARWLSLIENVQRQDLSPIEEARAYKERLAEGITQEELGQQVGKSRTYIAQKLRLLKLPDPLIFYLDRRAISEGHARQLMRLKGIYVKELPIEFNKEVSDLPDSWDDASSLLRMIRPEDNVYCWFIEKDGRNQDLITEGCVRFWKYVMTNNWKIPQWTVAAFWWASFVVYIELSVARLTTAIDNWEERFLTALWWRDCHGHRKPENKPFEDKTVSEMINDMMWWGYHSDISHSNAEELSSTDVLARIAERHIVGGSSGDRGYILPSYCQTWGECREVYLALLRAADENSFCSMGRLMKQKKQEAKEQLSMLRKLQDWNGSADEFLAKTGERLSDLKQRLEKASTLSELLKIIDEAQDAEYEIAEWRLRGERMAGQLLTELEGVSCDTPARGGGGP